MSEEKLYTKEEVLDALPSVVRDCYYACKRLIENKPRENYVTREELSMDVFNEANNSNLSNYMKIVVNLGLMNSERMTLPHTGKKKRVSRVVYTLPEGE